ncbi:MAG: glycosyltransferase family 4 protein [Planctomycetales bacterium]|nr:glycosyltransferase family 4 protein [Planctomycetales bacterium]
MKVLILHQNFVDHLHPGGTRHFELAKYLMTAGHEVTIVAGNVDYLTGQVIMKTRWGGAEQNLDGVRVLRAYTYPSLHRSFTWRVIAFLSFMVSSVWVALRAGKVDVVMGTSPPIFQLPSAWIVSALKRVPFLLEVRDLWPEFAVDMGVLKNPLLIRVARIVEKFFYARATHVIVNSPAYKDYLLGKSVPAAKISVVANGVDASMFDPAADGASIRQQFTLDDHFIATYAGALGQANDIPTILRAAQRLKQRHDIRILIVGGGKELPKLRELAQSLELENVIFGGAFPKQQMRDVLAASNCCLATLQDIPMFRTTYPNKVFDYMAAGRPTVLGIDGVIRKVVDDAHGGIFVPPGNDEKLAAAITTLADDPALCRTMGQSARVHVQEHFDRAKQAELFADVLKLTVQSGRKR